VKGCPPKPSGWLLEARGDARPRGMTAGAIAGDRIAQQNSAYDPCDHEAPPVKRRGFMLSAVRSTQAENDEPQPQVLFTFGLPNLKPEPCRPST
jgi:hypothetical protein